MLTLALLELNPQLEILRKPPRSKSERDIFSVIGDYCDDNFAKWMSSHSCLRSQLTEATPKSVIQFHNVAIQRDADIMTMLIDLVSEVISPTMILTYSLQKDDEREKVPSLKMMLYHSIGFHSLYVRCQHRFDFNSTLILLLSWDLLSMLSLACET